jgi:hypothetical protein
MPANAGTREDVHFECNINWENESCSRANNGLLFKLGRKHLLGSGFGKGYKVRVLKTKTAAALAYWLVGPG